MSPPLQLEPNLFNRVTVTESGCWEYQGGLTVNGYGRITFRKVRWTAHRLSWCLTHGDIPTGMDVCHHCDNRKCIRPSHLFLGTRRENMQDMSRKDRGRRSRLSDEQLQAIYELSKRGVPQSRIADKVNISQSYVSMIVMGRVQIRCQS